MVSKFKLLIIIIITIIISDIQLTSIILAEMLDNNIITFIYCID